MAGVPPTSLAAAEQAIRKQVELGEQQEPEIDQEEGEETVADEIRRLREEREELRQQDELYMLRAEVARLQRTREAGHTPGPSENSSTLSYRERPMRSAGGPRLRQPDPFKGKTLKEARTFLRQLESIFALSGDQYRDSHAKILYASMFLEGETADNWHHRHEISSLPEDYTWEEFRKEMFDAVEDPANRSLTIARAYEDAYQRSDQTAASFAAYLATLEDQMEPYTPAQRMRHLLVKLRRSLGDSITVYHQLPETRDDLISLATRLETAEGKTSRASHKHSASDSQNMPKKKKLRHDSKRGEDRGFRSKRRRGAVATQAKRMKCAATTAEKSAISGLDVHD